jgi:hypothetical protein
MKLTLGFHICILCGWLTVGAQVMPRSNGSCGAAASPSVSFDWLPATLDPTIDKVPSRNDIENQIDKTENALNAIKRPLDAESQKIAAQVRTFITHTREALKYDDLDGANALSGKAHALLLEICKECRPHSGQKAKLKPI